MSLLLKPVALLSLLILAQTSAVEPVVRSKMGVVRGTAMKSRLGREFLAFRGIPYAEAPLRFRNPQPKPPFTEVFDATRDGPACPQPYLDPADVSEDCLRLNVYSSDLTASRPVIVYLHPGGFYSVSGQSKNFAGPWSFMDQDIVLVTLNYRLGSLGFLALDLPEAPGNAGLKDQVLALRWVRDNIAAFGGDPGKVTLLGYSAGAVSITLHLVSPMSRGLFHRAIVMSGSGTKQQVYKSSQMEIARRQARAVGCQNSTEPKEIAECLQEIPAREMGESLIRMYEFGYNPVLIWSPVVERDFGQERFLEEDPQKAFLRGDFMKVPIIAGITADEFARSAVAVVENATLLQELDSDWLSKAPICFQFERNDTVSRELRSAFVSEPLEKSNKTLRELNVLFSDGIIGYPVHRFVRLASVHTDLFYYKFSYKAPRYSHLYYPQNKPYGVVHHDDLLYLFVASVVAPTFGPNDPESFMVERMTRMWSHFAETGNPNGIKELGDVEWRKYTDEERAYLDIGEELAERSGLYEDRYAVWERLFRI